MSKIGEKVYDNFENNSQRVNLKGRNLPPSPSQHRVAAKCAGALLNLEIMEAVISAHQAMRCLSDVL